MEIFASRTIKMNPISEQFENAASWTRQSFFRRNGSTFFIFLAGALLVGVLSVLTSPIVKGATGLVAAYSFDENGGTTAGDASGNGNTANLFGGATWASGHSGSGLSFDGTSGYATAPAVPYVANWTVSAWVRSPAAPSGNFFYSGPIHRDANFQLDWNHASPAFQGAAGVKVAGTWYPASSGALAAFSRLPDLLREVRALGRRLAALERKPDVEGGPAARG
jgi:hypothetical protein